MAEWLAEIIVAAIFIGFGIVLMIISWPFGMLYLGVLIGRGVHYISLSTSRGFWSDLLFVFTWPAYEWLESREED